MNPSTVQCLLPLLLLVSSITAQAPQDPLKDFCRRYGHQTTVIDRRLYIDGGWVYANPIEQNPVPTINQGIIFSDLDHVSDGMPTQYANLSKNNTIPDVAGGILWPDEVNKVFWLYGGEYSVAPSEFKLWGYDVLLDQWNQSSAPSRSTSAIKRVAYGAGTTLGGVGYYYGGYLNSLTNPLWGGDPLATSNMIIFDMDEDTISNNTGPDGTGRAEGVMVSVPASAAGLLIYFGGVEFPYGNTTEVAKPMTEIMVYDVGDNKWYTQTATGNVPATRRKFCAGATWADDQSSYNIYLYGGFGFGENITGFDDVYILTLPTFVWTKWYPDAPGASAPHGLLTCNVIDNAQMIVMGGNFTNSTACDVPTVGAQHNLNLGQLDPTNAKWYSYLPNLTDYAVPDAILSITGGSSDGGASNVSPPNGWSDPAIAVYFGQKANLSQRTPTRYIPSPTTTAIATPKPHPSSKIPVGTIAGGVIGGIIVLLIVGIGIWFCLKKRKTSGQNQETPIAQNGTSNVNELTGDHRHESKNAFVTTSPASPDYGAHMTYPSYTTSPPPMQSIYPMHYQHSAHGSQQYHQMQQQGYGFPHSSSASGSPPAVMYQQQPYFPPPETNRASPPLLHEMPTVMTPGIHHVIHQPAPQRADIADASVSSRSHERTRSDRYSQTNSQGY